MNKENWLPVANTDLSGNERKYLLEAFDSGWLSGSGSFVDRFEKNFADYFDSRYALTCSNGTVAIHLALLALGVGPGDEVIVPTLTFVATANAVTYCGATPVFADCHPDTWNVTVDTIRSLVTERTKGIIVVPLFGNPIEIEPINKLANEHGLFVVEDSAEAHGSEYKGHYTTSFSDIATFSFFGNKIISTGEGGMVITDNENLIKKLKLFRGQGMEPTRRYWFPIIGYNYRLTNLQCAIGVAQLERLPELIETRRRLAAQYSEILKNISTVTMQMEQTGGKSSWWMFSIRLNDHDTRERVMIALEKGGIESRPLFWPLHMLPPYESSKADCPIATQISLASLSLPSGGHVTTDDIKRIAKIITEET